MNLYAMLGSGSATNEAASLSKRLTVWHDAMVAHERKLRSGTAGEVCDDECPHAEARLLWSEAVDTFGSRAHELSFLRSRGGDTARRPAGRATSRPRSLVPSNGTGAAAEL